MIKYLRAANVKDGFLDLSDVKRMNFTPAEQQIFALKDGDVLVTEGSGSLSTVGASAVWQRNADGETYCFQNTLLRMRPRTHALDGRFLAWWARSAFASGLFAALATGANIYHLSAERVRTAQLDLPSLSEQRRIANFLEAETARIERLAQVQYSLRQKLDERDRALRDTKVGALLKTASEIPLRRLANLIEQGMSPRCEDIPRDDTGEWAVLKLSAVKAGCFDPKENKRLPDDVSPAKNYEIRVGDLLITRANTPTLVGDVAVATGDVRRLLLPDLIFRIELTAGVMPEYIAEVALSSRVRSQIESAARGSSQSMVKLRGEDIKEWPIPLASSSQQAMLVRIIAEGTKATARLRSAIDRQLGLLAERRQALITAAVTGQIDVSTASGRGIED